MKTKLTEKYKEKLIDVVSDQIIDNAYQSNDWIPSIVRDGFTGVSKWTIKELEDEFINEHGRKPLVCMDCEYEKITRKQFIEGMRCEECHKKHELKKILEGGKS